jgi:hypothetical protein
MLQLVAVTCVLLASKQEEVRPRRGSARIRAHPPAPAGADARSRPRAGGLPDRGAAV